MRFVSTSNMTWTAALGVALAALSGCGGGDASTTNATSGGATTGSGAGTTGAGGAGGENPLPDGGVDGSGGGSDCTSPWTISTIAAAGKPSYPSLAVGSDGRVWLAYKDGAADALELAHSDPAGWKIETVDSGGVGTSARMVLVGNDAPHIVYRDQMNGGIKHAGWDGASWKLEVIEPPAANPAWTGLSLIADKSGKLHAGYYAQDEVRYATNASGQWVIEVVETGFQTNFQKGHYTSIAFRGGAPEIVYNVVENNLFSHVYFKSRTSAGWNNGGDVGATGMWHLPTPFVVDSTGARHTFPFVSQGLLHQSGGSPTWKGTEIAVASFSDAVALGAGDVLHVASMSLNTGDLSYAHNKAGTWSSVPVDVTGTVTSASIAVETSGRVHLAYIENETKTLRYAASCP